jgi:flagellar motor protein MotB
MDGQIIRQSSSYRQGLVLGLTMAEIMILLVFCLLIALATFLRVEQIKRAEAEARFNAEHEGRLDAEQAVQLGAEREKRLLAEYTARLEAERAARHRAENVASAGQGISSIDQSLVAVLQRNPQLYERLKSLANSGKTAEADEFWRELVEAKEVIAVAKMKGLSVTDLRQTLDDAATLKAQGIDAKKAARDADIVRAIQGVMPAAGELTTTAHDIATVVERGMREPENTGHRWPPIINLSEADGYYFKSGSAELTPEFRKTVMESIPERILAIIKEFDVDIIEVVGHTDEQPIGQRQSNLDRNLVAVLKDNAGITSLVPADNAGLGLARAASVVSVLRKSSQLAGYKLIPLSGAQLVNVDESLALSGVPGDIRERRRIEIRLRQSARNKDRGR